MAIDDEGGGELEAGLALLFQFTLTRALGLPWISYSYCCRLITYWPARSICIPGAGSEFRRNSRRASPVNSYCHVIVKPA